MTARKLQKPIVIVVLLFMILSLTLTSTPTSSAAAPKFTITVTQGANGQISPGTTTVNSGGSQVFTITPSNGYYIASLIVDGSSVAVTSTFTFNNVQAAHSITAIFAINTFTITVTQGSNGVISPGTTTVNYGDSPSFTITPNSGYSLASLIVDYQSVAVTSTYTFNNVQADNSITATFTISTYNVTVVQGANGVISPKTTTVNYGDNQSFTVTPNSGYSIASLIVDGLPVTIASAYTFTNVQSAHSITAIFAINTFTITVTQGSNGVISPGTTTVNYGDNQTFTVTPSNGYSLASLIVDGSSFGVVSSYAFSNVQASHAITATFALTPTPTPKSTPTPTPSPSPSYMTNPIQTPESTSNPSPTPKSTEIPSPTPTLTPKPTISPTNPTPTTGSNAVWFYAISLVASIACITGLFVVKKRNGSSKKGVITRGQPPSSDFPLLSLTKGAQLPDSYSLMVTGDARAEKGLFCEQFADYFLKQGKPIIYVTYNRFPVEIRSDMKIHGWDITKFERKGNFVFVDACSSIASKKSQEEHYLRQPFGLSELGIAISSALKDFQGKSVVVLLDSTGPLFTKLDCSKVVEFLQDRCAQIKGQDSMFLFTVAAGTIPDNLQNRLEDMVDGLIELKAYTEKGLMRRKIIVKKLSGNNYSNVELAMNFPDVVIATEKE